MLTDTLIEDHRWGAADIEALCEQAAVATLSTLGLPHEICEIAILACDDTRIAELNTEFRDKPQPTNVLSWPSAERGARIDGAMPEPVNLPQDAELGDIAISYETCLREAQSSGKTLHDHATHLIIHGVLHLLGYDHIRDLDATLMEQTERDILGKLGIDDPY